MKAIPEVDRLVSHYSRAADVLEIEIDPAIKRTATISYEDLFLIHLGVRPGLPGELVLQGYTFIGFQRLRERVHGPSAGLPEHGAAELESFLKGIDVELQDEGKTVLIKDARYWDAAGVRVRTRVTPALEIVQDAVGDPVGIILTNANGIDEAAVREFFDLLFAAILPTDDDLHNPFRLTLSKAIATRWMAPLLGAAA